MTELRFDISVTAFIINDTNTSIKTDWGMSFKKWFNYSIMLFICNDTSKVKVKKRKIFIMQISVKGKKEGIY